jgi:hypothetical protein
VASPLHRASQYHGRTNERHPLAIPDLTSCAHVHMTFETAEMLGRVHINGRRVLIRLPESLDDLITLQQRRQSSNGANHATPHPCRAPCLHRPERPESPIVEKPSTEHGCGKLPDAPWWPLRLYRGTWLCRSLWTLLFLICDDYGMGVEPPIALYLRAGFTPLLVRLARTYCSQYPRQRPNFGSYHTSPR